MSSGVPRVSIGLPVYNGERYLASTLDSIVAQTFGDFELVISDNCSTDRTEEICRAYAARDPRIRFFRSDVNKGAAWNFRQVFELSRASYFRWAPADDVFAPESIAACVQVLDANPEAVLCYPKTMLIDGSGKSVGNYDDNLDLRSASPVERYRRAAAQIGLVNVIYGLMRAEHVRKTRLIRSYPGADIIFVLELALYGTFIEIDTPLFYRRMHDQASSAMKSALPQLRAYIDPSSKGRFFFHRWKTLSDQIVSVLRGPLRVTERVRLLYFLLREMLASREEYVKELTAIARTLLPRPHS